MRLPPAGLTVSTFNIERAMRERKQIVRSALDVLTAPLCGVASSVSANSARFSSASSVVMFFCGRF